MRISDCSSDVCSSDLVRSLERLTDLRDEVGKQLQHLARQAKQAEQYTAIQAERKIRDAEWKALEYRGLDEKLAALREGLSQEETRLQQLIAEQREAEAKIETGRVRREESMEALRSEEHTSELQSLMRTSYAVF